MGKSKKPSVPRYNHQDVPRNPQRGGGGGGRGSRKMHTFSKLSSSGSAASSKGKDQNKSLKQQRQKQHVRPIIPFGRSDRILLVGEGDFSFARSLAVHHRCRDVLATCYDSEDALHGKYPQVKENINDFLGSRSVKRVRESQDAGEAGEDEAVQGENERRKEQRDEGMMNDEERNPNDADVDQGRYDRRGQRVLYSVDARKLGSPAGGGKAIRTGFPRRGPQRPAWKNKRAPEAQRSGGPWDVICFNFPHVGGLSTDVNRQVRSNQELLVAFFKACVPFLSVPTKVDDEDGSGFDECTESQSSDDGNDGMEADDDNSNASAYAVTGKRNGWGKRRAELGQILVTLFEGEPYTLWNVRDLARHAGLRVVTSFRFPWDSYPGYSHARTLGQIDGRHGGRGGWKGEDREARTYVFEVKGNDDGSSVKCTWPSKAVARSGKKRAREESDSDDSD